MNREEIISFLERNIRIIVTFLFQWISTDGEVIAYILAVIHILLVVGSTISMIIAHTLYPAFWFQCCITAILIVVWLQHIVLKVCVLTVSEEKLHKSFAPSIPYISMFWSYVFNTDLNSALTTLVIAETVAVGCFSLQLVGRCTSYVYQSYNIELL
jgi:hypothetical protein